MVQEVIFRSFSFVRLSTYHFHQFKSEQCSFQKCNTVILTNSITLMICSSHCEQQHLDLQYTTTVQMFLPPAMVYPCNIQDKH